MAQRQRLGPLGGLAQRHRPEQPTPDRGQGLQGLAHLVIDCGFGFQSARHGASVGDGLGRVKAAFVVRPRALEVVSAQERLPLDQWEKAAQGGSCRRDGTCAPMRRVEHCVGLHWLQPYDTHPKASP